MKTWKAVRNGTVVTLLAMTSVLSLTTFAHTSAKGASSPSTSAKATVTVNTAESLGVVPLTALGVNTAVWENNLMDASVPTLLKRIDTAMLRYPGGSTSDVYHWKTNTVDGGGTIPQDNFDNFMGLAHKVGAEPIITVNAGTGSAAEAAAWVKDANVAHHDGVKYWEVGNEEYGSWENGNFANKPAGYAEKASQYIKAMKAIDMSIKIGVDLIAPGTGEADWNRAVLSELKKLGTPPDFGIVHWYAQQPGGESDAGLLSSTSQIATMMDTLKQQLGNIPVFVTETNSVSSNPGKQSTSLVNALFLDDDISTWLQAGAVNVDWWVLFNGMVTPSQGANVDPTLYGSTNYGDYGLLSSGTMDVNASEPAADTPFPAYYGYQMLGVVAQPRAVMVGSGSNNPMVAVHASKLPSGDLAVMLINKDPRQTVHVNLNLEGFMAKPAAEKLFYGESSKKVVQGRQNLKSISVPPYSVTDFILQAEGRSGSGSRTASNPPKLAATMKLSSKTIKPSDIETVTATFRNGKAKLSKAALAVEIYNPSGELVGQQLMQGVNLKPGQSSKPVALKWPVPNVPGTYVVRAFALEGNGAVVDSVDARAATFTVTEPNRVVSGDVTVTTKISDSSIAIGKPVTITTTYTNTSKIDWLSNGILNQYVYKDGKFLTQFAKNGTIAPGQTVVETATFTPTDAGTYTFPVGLFTGTWGNIQWFDNGAGPTLTVK